MPSPRRLLAPALARSCSTIGISVPATASLGRRSIRGSRCGSRDAITFAETPQATDRPLIHGAGHRLKCQLVELATSSFP